ncbi:MAG: hypothetical protein GY832_19385 [Chloroflexi bacterium]|nr:hypothetical protein [Chloroflexota bacterium]
MDEKRREHRNSIVGPVILIGLGVIFLLNNLGILSWSVWDVIFRLWPVLIIAGGLDILIGRRSVWGALLSLVLTVALIAGALWLYGTGIVAGPDSGAEEISQSLNEATEAQVSIGPAVGSLYIDALPESSKLVAGTIRPIHNERVQRDFEVQGDTAFFTLDSEGEFVGPFFGGPSDEWRWDLGLSSDVPLELDISLGAGQADLDLTGLTLNNLDVDMGVGEITIILPDEGRFQANIDSAIGQTTIVIPEGMSARIHFDTALAARQLPGRYHQRGDAYVSPSYDSADNRVDLEISQAIGNVTIRDDGGK